MKVVGIIPSRFGSSRFPGKPLIDLMGKSMIQRVYEGALKATRLHDLIVATDDERIYEHVKSFGGKVAMTSSEHPSGTDRCAEVVETFNLDADVILNIQGDEPLIDARQLDQLIAAFEDSSVQLATIASPKLSAEDYINVNRIKVVLDCNKDALYFSRSALPNAHYASDEVKKNYPFLRHIGLYAYRTETLKTIAKFSPTQLEQIESLEQLRWMYHGLKIRVVQTEIETPNIDVPADVDVVLEVLRKG